MAEEVMMEKTWVMIAVLKDKIKDLIEIQKLTKRARKTSLPKDEWLALKQILAPKKASWDHNWAASDARRGLTPVNGSGGPAEVDYKPWGDHLNYQDDESVTRKFSNEQLCQRSEESAAALEAAKGKSDCQGIAEALQVHEDWHLNFCRRIGYRPYWLSMNGADRAQEEVEAYGEQIKVLRDILSHLGCG